MADYRKGDILSYKSDEDILKVIQEDFTRSEDKYNPIKTAMEADLGRYWLIWDASNDPTAAEQGAAEPKIGALSALKLPTARAHIDTYVSIIMANLFPENAEWLHARPRPQIGDERNLEEIVEMFRQFRLFQLGEERMNFKRKFKRFVLQGLTTYWTVCYLRWKREGGWKYVGNNIQTEDENIIDTIKRYGGDLGKALGKKVKYDPNLGFEWQGIVTDRPELEVIHTFNGYPDPRGGAEFEQCSFFGDETRIPWHELYANEWKKDDNDGYGSGFYLNLNKLRDLHGSGQSNETREEQMYKNLGDQAGNDPVTNDEAKKENQFRDSIVIRRYFTRTAQIITDQDHKVVIAKLRHEDWPLFNWAWGDEGTFHRQSLMRLVEHLDQEFDSMINHALENWTRINAGTGFVKEGAVHPDYKGKPALPGTLTPVTEDPRQVAMYDRPPDISQSTHLFVDLFERNLEAVSGLGENTLSRYTTGRKKATEVEYVNQAGANRQGQAIIDIEGNVASPLMNAMTKLELRKFEQAVPMAFKSDKGEVFETISKEWIRQYGNLIIFECRGSNLVNQRMMEASGIQNLFTMAAQNPHTAQIANWPWLFVEAGKRVAFLPDPEQVLNPEMQDKSSIPPELELDLMRIGRSIPPRINDDHNAHLQVHQMQLEREMLKVEEGGAPDEKLIQLLQIHIQKTQEKIAQMQQQTPTAATGEAAPGQILSQNTGGTRAANTMSPQAPGRAPAKKEEVAG
jgi:hypothetical protein